MRRLAEDTAIEVTRGARRFRVRVFRWVSGARRPVTVWSAVELVNIHREMGRAE